MHGKVAVALAGYPKLWKSCFYCVAAEQMHPELEIIRAQLS